MKDLVSGISPVYLGQIQKSILSLHFCICYKKNSLEQYWSRDSILNKQFFGHYMSRNHFQNILWNLHISDPDETNPQKGEANHDPLFLVRPMVDMMQRNFCTKYRPGKELSLDESMCPFKGRVHFKCYNPKIQTGSILNILWSVNLALATFVALKSIQEMHLASHRVMYRNYRMHQNVLHCPRFVRFSTVVGHGSS